MKKPRPTHFPLPNELHYELVHFLPVEYCVRLLRSLNPTFSHLLDASENSNNNDLNSKLKQQQPKPTNVYPIGFYISGRRHVRVETPLTTIRNYFANVLPGNQGQNRLHRIDKAIGSIVAAAEPILFSTGSGFLIFTGTGMMTMPFLSQGFFTTLPMNNILVANSIYEECHSIFNHYMGDLSADTNEDFEPLFGECWNVLKAHLEAIKNLIHLAYIPHGSIHATIPGQEPINGHYFQMTQALLNEYKTRFKLLRSETGMESNPANE